MSHNSDSDGDWIPLPRQGDLLNPSKLKPEDTRGPPVKIRRKLSEKGWALVDEASHRSELKKDNLNLNQELLGPVRKHTKDIDNTALHTFVVSEIELLSLKNEESEGKGPRGAPRSIAEPATKDQDDKLQELEAGIKSLNFRMDAIQVNINELQKQFHDLEVMLAAQGLVRSAYSEPSLLRRYDINLHRAAIAVLGRPDVKLPTRIQTQGLPRNGHVQPEGQPISDSKDPLLLPLKSIGVGPSGAEDTFRWFEMQQSELQSQSRLQANPPMYTLNNSSSRSEEPEETLKTAQIEGKKISRLGTQHQDHDETNMDNAYTAAWHSNDPKDK